MPLACHVMLRARDDRVVATTPAERRALSSRVFEIGARFPLLSHRTADTHSHLAVMGQEDQACELARRLESSLAQVLDIPCGFKPAHVVPIRDQHHLRSTFDYIFRQEDHHGLAGDRLHDGSNLPDLVGMRLAGARTISNVRRWLPRVRRADLLVHFQGVNLDGPIDPHLLPEAAAAALCLPSLQGNFTSAVVGRVAVVQLGSELTTAELSELLQVDVRTVKRARRRLVPQPVLTATARQAAVRTALSG